VQLAGREPAAIEAAMLETLRAGRSSGFVRSGIDLTMLADRIYQTMRHAGLGLFHRYIAVQRVSGLLCDISCVVSRQFRLATLSWTALARCWPSSGLCGRGMRTTGNIVRTAGKRAALIHARDTVLRGVAER
jgi:hypothetical protein